MASLNANHILVTVWNEYLESELIESKMEQFEPFLVNFLSSYPGVWDIQFATRWVLDTVITLITIRSTRCDLPSSQFPLD